jgi:serine/threonine-protein kinase
VTDLRAQLQSTLGDAYTIERELGGGGMSRVFLATERALNRKVVIKILPSETAGGVSIDRFKREIELAARLQQANIVPLLSAGDAGGVPYFTMPYVDGESLRARLAKGGELPIPEAVGILKEVARALAYAHGQGVVHRDIKPDNVLISGGSAVVTDFGVAKALSAATTGAGEHLTGTGLAIGTPAYMSPEQATGDANTDHRADIYSFGCLAYELLAGSAPFAGRTPQQTVAAQITEHPDPVERRRPAVPWQLSALVARCLAKNPADRPQASQELIAALEEAAATPSTPAQTSARPARRSRMPLLLVAGAIVVLGGALLIAPLVRRPTVDASLSIAVLPFANSTGDTSAVYLGEGLSDEVRAMLVSAGGISVMARGASLRFAGKTAKEVGAELDVATVLQGSLTRGAGATRVVAELVRVRDDLVVWNRTFDLAATARPAFRDSLVRGIAAALHARTVPGGERVTAATVRGTADDFAFDLYLKGEYFRRQFDPTRAVALLRQAVDRDSMFARAHASLALAYAGLPMAGTALPADAVRRAQISAERALRLEPNASLAHLAKGMTLYVSELDFKSAETATAQAVAADTSNIEALVWHSFMLGALGRVDEAYAETLRAARLDPYSVDVLVFRQAIPVAMNRFRETIDMTPPILAVAPSSVIGQWNLALAYAFLGIRDSAVMVMEKVIRDANHELGVHAIATFMYAAAGQWERAAEQRALAYRHAGNSPNYARTIVAMAYGEYDAAMEALERGIAAKEPLFSTILITCEPTLAKLHSMPRFVAVAERLGARMCPPAEPWPIGPAPRAR